MQSITIKVEASLAKEMDQAMQHGYATKTEFIRDAIRQKIKREQQEEWLRLLKKNFGAAKTKTTLAHDRRIREEVGRELLKEHRLE